MTSDLNLPLHQEMRCKVDEPMNHLKQLVLKMTGSYAFYKRDKIFKCNKEFATLFGYTQDEILTVKMSELIKENIKHIKLNRFESYSEKAKQRTGIRRDGTTFNLEIVDYAYSNQDQELRITIIKDISERIEYEKMLSQLAYFDGLTKLPNLNYFLNVLEEEIVQAKSTHEEIVVYFIQFGYFKAINELFGYSFGDKLIIDCGKKLKLYEDDHTLIAHNNSDEFLILRRHQKEDKELLKLAEELLADFKDPIMIEGHDAYATVNIGISSFPTNGSDPNRLIRLAKWAMYSNKKEHHSNFSRFELKNFENSLKNLAMESDLREAIKNKQFSLAYQPQKNLYTNKIVGIEALIRWNHPKKGNIPPLDFISFAEKTGLIIEIGDWVLQEACRQNKAWQDAGYEDIVVSVNLSAIQFYENDLVIKVEKVLKETSLAPRFLELEITESMAMTNEDLILKTLHQLRELGVLISIDDFGTGYSSLKYLSVFPITKLKIDKVFMDEKQKQNRSIVKSIINMSHSLDMKVIAEGVETKEQLNFLVNEHCDEMQGYFLSKPLPAKELEDFLKEH